MSLTDGKCDWCRGDYRSRDRQDRMPSPPLRVFSTPATMGEVIGYVQPANEAMPGGRIPVMCSLVCVAAKELDDELKREIRDDMRERVESALLRVPAEDLGKLLTWPRGY